MLSALLGAICAASMAFAPMLVEPSSNILNNDGDFTSVHSAYYDANTDYDLTVNRFYNFTSAAFNPDGDSSFSIPIGEYGLAEVIEGNPSNIFGAWDIEGEMGSDGFKLDGGSYTSVVDFYVGGVFIATLSPDNHGTYYLPVVPTDLYETYPANSHYNGWLFDHQGYQLGTDTVADIAEGLTSGIGTVATGIGGGLQSLMQNIFLVGTVDDETGAFTATGLSTFGIVTVVFCGLALALGLSRWIVGFASSLGSRNR